MPLSRPINYAHPAAPDFSQNLIIAKKPLRIGQIEFAEHVIQGFFSLTLVSIDAHTCDKKTVETKTATNAQWRSTVVASVRRFLEIQGDRTARPVHDSQDGGKRLAITNRNRKLRTLFTDIPGAGGRSEKVGYRF